MVIKQSVIDRFNSFYTDTKSCINYPILNKDGYGVMQTYIEGVKKHYLMHRVSYQLTYGNKLKSSQLVCHRCDNPSCINPNHLFLGTHIDNIKDKVRKGRQAKGKDNGRYTHGKYTKESKKFRKDNPKPNISNRLLKDEQVKEIKNLIKKGDRNLKEISSETGVNYNTIRDISCGRVYKDI